MNDTLEINCTACEDSFDVHGLLAKNIKAGKIPSTTIIDLCGVCRQSYKSGKLNFDIYGDWVVK